FVGDASGGDGRDQGFDSVGGQDNVEPTVLVTEPVETELPGPKLSKKKRVEPTVPVTPPAFFKTVRGMEHEQLFTELNVSVARNLSLSSEAKDKEIEDLKSQLLKAMEESAEVAQLRAYVSGLEATENSLRGEVASTKDHNVLLEQECNYLKLKVTGLKSTIAKKDHELSDLGASSSSLKSQNQSLVDQVHELEISSADLREKLEMYEGSLKQLEEFQDNLMGPLRTR
ncbi:hypothetical protein Tco_1128951, partial [Tanacetum coccineum]